jgi:hypothetical protein
MPCSQLPEGRRFGGGGGGTEHTQQFQIIDAYSLRRNSEIASFPFSYRGRLSILTSPPTSLRTT